MIGKLVNKFKKHSLQNQQQHQCLANTDKKLIQIDFIPSSSTSTIQCQNLMESNQEDKHVFKNNAFLNYNDLNKKVFIFFIIFLLLFIKI